MAANSAPIRDVGMDRRWVIVKDRVERIRPATGEATDVALSTFHKE